LEAGSPTPTESSLAGLDEREPLSEEIKLLELELEVIELLLYPSSKY